MPNIENIKLAITVMERVKKNEEELGRRLLDLRLFQGNFDTGLVRPLKTEEEALNRCGTVCCFAGWLAVSPEFVKMGYELDVYATPALAGMNYIESIKLLFGIDQSAAFGLVHNVGNNDFYYDKPTNDVTVDDVIEKLKSFL